MSASPLFERSTLSPPGANARLRPAHLSAMTHPQPASGLDAPDADLVQRAQAGDREAFGDLYERHLDAVYRYVFYRVSDSREAEDLTETVFLKAWTALPRYRPTEFPFTAWLYRIAHNLLVDRLRSHKAQAPLDDSISDDAPSLEAHLAQRELHTALRQAWARLDAAQQQVLALRFLSNLSHAETAQVIGCSEGAARVLQHRALAALRRLWPGGWNE